MRIRGMIGDWPVDLTVMLEPEEWAQLTAPMPSPARAVEGESPVQPSAAGDAHWQATQDLLRQAGQLDGPALLAELGALAGSMAAGKRLLVRLRHCPRVRLENGPDSPIYHWVG